eukprot:879300-Prorocentrum_minimum.AAC.1
MVYRGSTGGLQGVIRGSSGGLQGVIRGSSGGHQGGVWAWRTVFQSTAVVGDIHTNPLKARPTPV